MRISKLYLLVFILIFSCLLNAQKTVILTDDHQKYQLGLSLETLEDPSGQLTIEDVTSPQYSSQ
ncbi:MAG: hypothetical protein KAT17_10755, partial [Candidatus Aminicenantes bacterium]|nr:hypothetical protein [Candidatus Aminicenantes bacterium]